MHNIRVVLALGKIAFDTYLRFLKDQRVNTKGLIFKHAAFYVLPEPHPALCASYHPSRQNTQTGRLTLQMFDHVFRNIRGFLAAENSNVHQYV